MALERSVPFPLRLQWWHKALAIVLLAIILELAGLSQPLVQLFSRGTTPLKAAWVRGFNVVYIFGDNLKKLPKAAQRIQDLELRLVEASSSLAELETLQRENEELRFLLGNSDLTQEKGVITTPVIAFSQSAIAAGEKTGIQLGAVVLSRNTLLGQVSVVQSHQSAVTLLFEKDSQPILARTESGVKGLIIGDGRKILFSEVSKKDVLTVGERIVTLGQPQIEQNLPIGRIIKVQNDPTASVQAAVVEQAVSFFETPIVEVR